MPPRQNTKYEFLRFFNPSRYVVSDFCGFIQMLCASTSDLSGLVRTCCPVRAQFEATKIAAFTASFGLTDNVSNGYCHVPPYFTTVASSINCTLFLGPKTLKLSGIQIFCSFGVNYFCHKIWTISWNCGISCGGNLKLNEFDGQIVPHCMSNQEAKWA